MHKLVQAVYVLLTWQSQFMLTHGNRILLQQNNAGALLMVIAKRPIMTRQNMAGKIVQDQRSQLACL